MQIELVINDEEKIFSVPYVPQLAKRKYLEIMAQAEEKEEHPTVREQIEEEDAMFSILSDVVFKGKFTLDELYKGASTEYNESKLQEAIFGKKPKETKKGNEQGK